MISNDSKTIWRINDQLELIRVKQNNQELVFLNGVLLDKAKNRFIIAPDLINYKYVVVIEDYSWWHDNHYDITDWMQQHLPRGENHAQGMIIEFDTEQQRDWFLLRWM
jgi:hypothetical protein